MNETSKAMRRRRREDEENQFPWFKIMSGRGVDVGAGADPLKMSDCQPFDLSNGDANHLSRYFPEGSLDYIHASHSLEHMIDPRAAILDWATCLKPGGHIILTVPDFDLYEKCRWPSPFNSDHKTAWSLWRRADPRCPVLVHLPTFLKDLEACGLWTVRMKFVDTNYNYRAPVDLEQSYPADGPEMWLESVLRKARP